MSRTILPFQIAGQHIDYRLIRRTRQKHINIRVSHTGEIVVSAPIHTSGDKINEAVRLRAKWVESHVLQIRELRMGISELAAFPINGKLFHVEIVKSDGIRDRVKICHNESIICLSSPVEDRARHMIAVKRALVRNAAQQVKPEVEAFARCAGVPITRTFIRDQRTRWGSSSVRRNISLNWRVFMAPSTVRQYLIYHELAHQLHMNHSPAFWTQVETWCPGYGRWDKWLKKHSYLLGLFR